jgi:hypothetical protein
MIGELIPTGVTFGTGRISVNDQFSGTAEFNYVEVSGNLSAGTGGVIYSGGTDLYSIFSTGSGADYWTAGTGTNSIAQIGGSNISSGITSVAEGTGTIAGGNYSHAEGFGSQAFGVASHAEGESTTAIGDGSHTEGIYTTASGFYSHAEGGYTIASGQSSHAEGYQTTASGFYSHTEGEGTTASGSQSHAGGFGSIASGATSFIHSYDSIVTGDRSAVIGGQNITGTTADTVYVPYLNIQSLATGTSVNNLGVDSGGNVVVGSAGGGATIDPYINVGGTGSTITWNVSGLSTNYEAILVSATTTINLTNVRNGEYGTIILEQDGIGGRAVSLGTVNGGAATHRVVNGGGGLPTLTSTAHAIDILSFTYNGSAMYWTVGNDYT